DLQEAELERDRLGILVGAGVTGSSLIQPPSARASDRLGGTPDRNVLLRSLEAAAHDVQHLFPEHQSQGAVDLLLLIEKQPYPRIGSIQTFAARRHGVRNVFAARSIVADANLAQLIGLVEEDRILVARGTA